MSARHIEEDDSLKRHQSRGKNNAPQGRQTIESTLRKSAEGLLGKLGTFFSGAPDS